MYVVLLTSRDTRADLVTGLDAGADKSIRADENSWQQMERYIAEHSDAQFSHGICPSCYEKVKLDFESGGNAVFNSSHAGM